MVKSRRSITKSDIRGIVVPMVTPFKSVSGNPLDIPALERLADYLISNGVHGLMVLGTSGEFALISRDERRLVIESVVNRSKGRLPVIAGVSSPGTNDAIDLGNDALKAGADVILSTGPYYYKTSEEGLFNHFQSLIDRVNLPLMIYNIPSWTGYNVPASVVKKLVKSNPNKIVGVKYTTNDMVEFLGYLRKLRNDISIMIGSDALILPALEMGASGAVVGSANVFPELTSQIYEAHNRGDLARAKELQTKLDPFTETMILGTFPAALKAALKLIKVDCGPVRLPLVELDDAELRDVRESMVWKIRQS